MHGVIWRILLEKWWQSMQTQWNWTNYRILNNYLRMKRIKQLYMELYKIENIEKSRSIVISIERNAAA